MFKRIKLIKFYLLTTAVTKTSVEFTKRFLARVKLGFLKLNSSVKTNG